MNPPTSIELMRTDGEIQTLPLEPGATLQIASPRPIVGGVPEPGGMIALSGIAAIRLVRPDDEPPAPVPKRQRKAVA